MKWRNHALMGVSIAIMMDLNPWEVGLCAFGSNLPDQLEKIGRFRIFGHRALTHELLLWLVPFVTFLLLPVLSKSTSGPAGTILPLETVAFTHFLAVRTWVLFLPGLIHLAGDVMTPRGIQVAGRRVSLKLFETGQVLEYLVSALFVGLAVVHKLGWENVFPGGP